MEDDEALFHKNFITLFLGLWCGGRQGADLVCLFWRLAGRLYGVSVIEDTYIVLCGLLCNGKS